MAVINFLYRHWRRIGLLAAAVWSTFGISYWGLIDPRAMFVLLLLAVWVVGTFALPLRRRSLTEQDER